MIRPSIRLVCVSLLVLLAFPVRAFADNCSSRFDCFATVAGAAAAAAGAGVVAGLGSIPRVKRRSFNPCKMANALFWLALVLTLILLAATIYFWLTILPLLLGSSGPSLGVSIIVLIFCFAILTALGSVVGFLWLEYFRYRALCNASTP